MRIDELLDAIEAMDGVKGVRLLMGFDATSEYGDCTLYKLNVYVEKPPDLGINVKERVGVKMEQR